MRTHKKFQIAIVIGVVFSILVDYWSSQGTHTIAILAAYAVASLFSYLMLERFHLKENLTLSVVVALELVTVLSFVLLG